MLDGTKLTFAFSFFSEMNSSSNTSYLDILFSVLQRESPSKTFWNTFSNSSMDKKVSLVENMLRARKLLPQAIGDEAKSVKNEAMVDKMLLSNGHHVYKSHYAMALNFCNKR